MYETRFPDPLGYGPGLNRFSDPTGKAFGLIYLGSIANVTFFETILRDRADGREARLRGGLRRDREAFVGEHRPCRAAGAGGSDRRRPAMAVPYDVAGARDQSWSVAFHDHPGGPDVVLYPSRLNEERCIALYDRAIGKVQVTTTPRLLDCRSELEANHQGMVSFPPA
jgi:RES domain